MRATTLLRVKRALRRAPGGGLGGRPRRHLRRKRGIALVMVMGAIAILTVMLAEFQDETSAELAAATAQRDEIQAEYMARSALNLSRLLIASEPTMRKAIAPLFMMMKRTPPQLPLWEFSDRLLGAFNDQESSSEFSATAGVDLNLGRNLGMPNGRWELSIVDEDAKINMNLGGANEIAHIRLAREIMGLISPIQYDPLFQSSDTTGQFADRLGTCQALIDWADVDEQAFNCDPRAITAASSGGVEDNVYATFPRPYRRKNAPYDSFEELHMIRGVNEDFWATFVDPSPTDPKKRVVTVWGQGAVNVNTANAQTLLALVCSAAVDNTPVCTDPTQAATFLAGVTMARGISMGAPLFGSAKDFVSAMSGQGQMGQLLASTLGMQPVQFKSAADFQKSITTESKMFSVYAVGVKKGYRRETRVKIHAVLDFRNAPAMGASMTGTAGAAGMSGVSGVSGIPGMNAGTQATTLGSTNSVAAANMPSTGGKFVYYRIE